MLSNCASFLFSRPTQLLHALPPAASAAVAQIAAGLLAVCLVFFAIAAFHLEFPLILVAMLQAVMAAGLGRMLGLASWWFAINLAFFPALVWFLSFGVSPAWFLAAFLALS